MIPTATSIQSILNSYTSKPDSIPGVVFQAVKKDGTLLFDGVSGVKGVDHKDQPMTKDTVFWTASITKLITAIGALQLVEKGKFNLDDPAEKYLPVLGTFQILTGFSGNKPNFKEATTKITLRHLLTHTSGIGSQVFNPLLSKYYAINNIPPTATTIRSSLDVPLVSEPGTKWEYGTSIDWVGLILEAVTGEKLETYFKKNIFEPLGIKSSTFYLTPEVAANHAHLHDRALNDSLSESPSHLPTADQVDVQLGGLGLHMTGPDVMAVLQALLNEGVGKSGNRILKKESVELLLADQTTKMGIALPDSLLVPAVPGVSNPGPENLEGAEKTWSFGGVKITKDFKTGKSAGSVWWAGIPNCYWWIDTTKGVAGVLMAQLAPFLDPVVMECWEKVEQKVYEGFNLQSL